MKITQESDYAVRAVVYMAKSDGKRIEAKILAEECSIPLRFLLKLLRKLGQASIVKSFRGINGGYILKKSPKDISLKEIIETIEGPLVLNKCIEDPSKCSDNRNGNCMLNKELQRIQEVIADELLNVTVETLVKET